MDIRLIVSDIDGTLLPTGSRISAATVEAVRACREKGVEFVVASGRWYPSARQIAVEQLGIEDGYMIICNGGAVVKCDGEILMEDGLSKEQARFVYDLLRREKVLMTSYVRGAIYRLNTGYLTVFHLPELGGYFGGREYNVVDDDENAFFEKALLSPYKMEAYSDDPALLGRLREKLVSAGLCVNSSFSFNLEIMAPQSGKGRAVNWLADHLGLSKENIMGFGDYTNDLSMLACCGFPVAVENAADEVKNICRAVCPACEADGVAQALKKYLLGDENR